MTRKHFEAVAAIIKAEQPFYPTMMKRVARKLADVFEDSNQGRFDYGRFLKACGVPDEAPETTKTTE